MEIGRTVVSFSKLQKPCIAHFCYFASLNRMNYKKRPDFPNALHHVMARGVARQKIFTDSNDYQLFLKKLGNCLQRNNVKCFAWALMPNHFHLLVQRTTVPIHKFMQSFLISYAMYYNCRHQRPGHLFQNRFKSILCQHDKYLFTLIKYIHLNPLRAKLVGNLDELKLFPWCGHGALMGNEVYPWHDVDFVSQLFDEDKGVAGNSYAEFMRSGLSEKEMDYARYGKVVKTKDVGWKSTSSLTEQEKKQADVGILGDQYFIQNALSKRKMIVPVNDKDFVFDDIIRQAADVFNISFQLIFTNRRQVEVVQARSLVCAWSIDVFQRLPDEVALYLGVTTKTVYRLVNRGRELIHLKPGYGYKSC